MAKTPNASEDRAARARAASRLAFALALRWREELGRVPSAHLRAAEALCLAHSVASGLRALALFGAGRALRSRDPGCLFRALSPEARSHVASATRTRPERLERSLASLRGVLHARRGVRTYDARLDAVDLAVVRRLARGVQRVLGRHRPSPERVAPPPAAARPEAARPARRSCSFCGKGQREVRKLIAGPAVHICDECIGLCNDILAEECARA